MSRSQKWNVVPCEYELWTHVNSPYDFHNWPARVQHQLNGFTPIFHSELTPMLPIRRNNAFSQPSTQKTKFSEFVFQDPPHNNRGHVDVVSEIVTSSTGCINYFPHELYQLF